MDIKYNMIQPNVYVYDEKGELSLMDMSHKAIQNLGNIFIYNT